MLYVATGDKGQIYSVTPEGKGEVFYASDEAHIRVLAFDGKGNLIAGTEPSGRVLRLTKAKEGANRRRICVVRNAETRGDGAGSGIGWRDLCGRDR